MLAGPRPPLFIDQQQPLVTKRKTTAGHQQAAFASAKINRTRREKDVVAEATELYILVDTRYCTA